MIFEDADLIPTDNTILDSRVDNLSSIISTDTQLFVIVLSCKFRAGSRDQSYASMGGF